MSHQLNMEIYLDVAECIKSMVDWVDSQIDESSSTAKSIKYSAVDNDENSYIHQSIRSTDKSIKNIRRLMKSRISTAIAIPRFLLTDALKPIYPIYRYRAPFGSLNRISSESMLHIHIKCSSKWMLEFRFPRGFFTADKQLSLVFRVNFGAIFELFQMIIALRQINVPQFNVSEFEPGPEHEKTYHTHNNHSPRSIMPEFNAFVMQGICQINVFNLN